jgi:acyl-coenzyme A thioesterase PaaI-like protein
VTDPTSPTAEPDLFPDLNQVIDRVRRHYDDGCFACGRANPFGLAIDHFRQEGGSIVARFRPRPEHRGVFGVLHGGLAATALDEIMVWAGIVDAGVLSVTANCQLKYRRSVPLDQELEIRGWIAERSGRRLRAGAELAAEAGVAVEATGLYVVSHPISDLLGTG